jgi:hypothetical protein
MRLPDWQSRLDAYIASARGRAYSPGEFDCCTACADVVYAVTGVDLMSDLRGTYNTDCGAYKLIRRLGGMSALLSSRLGPEIDPRIALPGDIGVGGDDGESAVFCLGSTWASVGSSGLTIVRPPKMAWRCHG